MYANSSCVLQQRLPDIQREVEHQFREMEGAGQVIESLLVKKAQCKKEVATQPMSRKEADEHLADMYAFHMRSCAYLLRGS